MNCLRCLRSYREGKLLVVLLLIFQLNVMFNYVSAQPSGHLCLVILRILFNIIELLGAKFLRHWCGLGNLRVSQASSPRSGVGTARN